MSNARRRPPPPRKSHVALLTGALALAASLALGPSCLERRAERLDDDATQKRCATCHGDPARSGDYLLKAAPPRDLLAASGPEYPGVGAHAIHLNAGPTHGAIKCNECHIVPERVDSPGHADDDRPAELVFGPISRKGERDPQYDSVGRTCSNTWCHREQADAVWTEPRSSTQACGTCHGLPPALPHPQSERCEVCHGDVVDAQRHFIAPELHVDGKVQATPGGCSSCHGHDDEPAPPLDTRGNEATSAIGVGAHAAHLTGGAFGRPLQCNECHQVPETADAAGHIDGLPARVALSGVAATGGRRPSWNRKTTSCADSWCHGPGSDTASQSPSWIGNETLTCGSCHGAPPPAPHPQLTNCGQCHSDVAPDDNGKIIDRARHVDGVVDVDVDPSCTSCHGQDNPGPPRDVSGNIGSNFPGVGAHQAHLGAGAQSRAVPCAECHVVPKTPLAPGHIDTPLPAEIRFSGAALAFDAAPAYQGGACVGTPCHGGDFPGTHRSGGTNLAPEWTKVDGTQAMCGSCHSLPPPPPHPYPTNCSACHEDMAADNLTFRHPELHVDGVVTFTVP